MSLADDDGDADMVALTPAPNQLAPVPDAQPTKKPPRRGCGVCRTCLFATGQVRLRCWQTAALQCCLYALCRELDC
jgi:hypothetical protein